MIENPPVGEDQQIQHVAALMVAQLEKRYPGNDVVRRGVHAKGHGCVTATFEILSGIDPKYQFGVFSEPGKTYKAVVRFSNAATSVTDDSPTDKNGVQSHGSRGMAIKLLNAHEPMLEPDPSGTTQDFLMINQPVFAFANVEDYEFLSEVLLKSIVPATHGDDASDFFKILGDPSNTNLAQRARVGTTAKIVQRIRSLSTTTDPKAFQTPPASPVDNDYFGASPFMLGAKYVMRFRCAAVPPNAAATDISHPNYLRENLIQRLRDTGAGNVVFNFDIQARPADAINPDTEIENASSDWNGDDWIRMAILTIPLQELGDDDQCEKLQFSPWHCTEAHRPLGGINRLRRAVYTASADERSTPKST